VVKEQLVHAVAMKEGMSKVMKISAIIAGVDYEERFDENKDYYEDENAHEYEQNDHDEMEPDEIYENMNTNHIHEVKEDDEDTAVDFATVGSEVTK